MSRCRSLSDALATLPNLSDKIIKSDEQYCKAGGFSDVYKCQYDSSAGLVEVAAKSFRFLFTLGETEKDNHESRIRKVSISTTLINLITT
ncbi:hypothetical protein OG21DRAFT_1517158 [Imleria badia]|nr:hypothetical protein OG21DRAFT_1517158 [Imleria badia]